MRSTIIIIINKAIRIKCTDYLHSITGYMVENKNEYDGIIENNKT